MNSRQIRMVLLVAVVVASLVGVLLGAKACTAKQAAEALAAERAAENAHMVPTQSQDFVAIAYDNSTTNLSFAKDKEGAWIWADDPTFPLDGKYLEELSAIITTLDPMQTLTTPDALETYGLEVPSATITATAEDGTKTVLFLGKALTDGSYYLKTADAATVYVVADTLHQRVNMGVYEMAVLEQFPILTAENIRSLTIQGTKTVAIFVAGGVWTMEGEDVSKHDTVVALAAQLSTLAFAACRDFNPSEKAVEICGLLAPAVVVTVEYVTDQGESAQMLLTIGTNTPEGGGRFARLGDSTTIHSLPSEKGSVLLDIARNGLTPT